MRDDADEYRAFYRPKKIEEGARYQDFIMERLHRVGIVLQPYTSRAGQLKGENLLGLEIKNDTKLAQTGNLYIEVAEKAFPRPGPYVESGIFRSDNTWLYGLGTYQVFFIFAKSTLRNCWACREQMHLREVPKPTSKGFLLPLEKAEQLKARKLTFDLKGNIVSMELGGDLAPLDLSSIETPKQFQMRLGL